MDGLKLKYLWLFPFMIWFARVSPGLLDISININTALRLGENAGHELVQKKVNYFLAGNVEYLAKKQQYERAIAAKQSRIDGMRAANANASREKGAFDPYNNKIQRVEREMEALTNSFLAYVSKITQPIKNKYSRYEDFTFSNSEALFGLITMVAIAVLFPVMGWLAGSFTCHADNDFKYYGLIAVSFFCQFSSGYMSSMGITIFSSSERLGYAYWVVTCLFPFFYLVAADRQQKLTKEYNERVSETMEQRRGKMKLKVDESMTVRTANAKASNTLKSHSTMKGMPKYVANAYPMVNGKTKSAFRESAKKYIWWLSLKYGQVERGVIPALVMETGVSKDTLSSVKRYAKDLINRDEQAAYQKIAQLQIELNINDEGQLILPESIEKVEN